MFHKALTSLTISMAVVAGIEITPNEDSDYTLAPADLRALVEDGMTKELLEAISSQIDVYIKMTQVDDFIDAVSALTTETPKTVGLYDL